MSGGDLMKDKSEEATGRPKKPYVKPEVRRVPLRPEEAVLGGCKTASAIGPGQPTCATLNCNVLAS